MSKIIDIPYGTYLAYVTDMNTSDENVDLYFEIAYGEWRGYFGVKDKVLSLQIPSGAYRRNIGYAGAVKEVVENAAGDNRTVVAIIIGELKNNTENKYRNITDVVDWRTCDTLSPEAKAWAEQHYDDNVDDTTPLAYDMLPYALQYAQAGLKVFPLCPCDKVPLKGTKGFHDATDNIDKIKKWWTTNPFYNIGLATGSGLSIIDVDEGVDEQGRKKEGEQSIKAWQDENGILPDTLTAITGRGGRHLYYKTTNPYGSATGVLKDVDVRSDGGYVVLPPSIHKNGNRYKFIGDFNVDKIVPANETVNKFLALVNSNKAVSVNVSNYAETIKIVPQTDILDRLSFDEGSRNDSLFRYGCSLQGKGYDDIKIYDELTKINLGKCNPPLNVEEVNKIYNSVITKPKGNNSNKPNSTDNSDNITINTISESPSPEIPEVKIYPYVIVKDLPNGESRQSIHPQRLAAYIRLINHYFFIAGNGEKPVPYWYENGYYKQCNDLYFLGQIKHYICCSEYR